MKPIRLMAGFLTVGFWTLMSRILGFVREILILSLIGPGPLMDAFVAAFRLPNMFRRFFAEGAFNASFVPMFSKRVEGDEDAANFASDALAWLSLLTLSLTALAMIFMPALVWATAGGFAGDERFDITVGYGRITFPYIFFMSLAALFSGILNATGRFAVAAAAPVLLNVMVIAAMLAARAAEAPVVEWLVWTIPFAGVAQLALTWSAASRAGYALNLRIPRPSPAMRQLLVTAIPAALATGVMQINLVVGQLVASRFEGAVSWLFAADRLYQLPLGVIGIAVGIVLLPDLSRRLKAEDADGSRNALSRAAEFSMAFTLPAAVALVVIPLPMVSVLYERGATDADDVRAIAIATAIYGLGLPAFVLQKVQQPLYFARSDTRSPFRFALVAMVVNAVAAFGLVPLVGWAAPAVAATLAGWVMVVLLATGTRRMGAIAQLDARFWQRLWRIVVASVLMGLCLWGAMHGLGDLLITPTIRYAALLALILAGILSYFLAAQLVGALRLRELRSVLRRG